MHTSTPTPSYAVVSLSGGLDSSTLLLKLLADGYTCTCISFDYGQKHRIELQRAQELVKYLNDSGKFPSIVHKVITIGGLSDLLVSGLVDNNSMELKEGHYAHQTALTSVVPNRNAIFAAITYAVALSIYKKTGSPCKIALGTHMGDFDNQKKEGIYPDCSEEFRSAIEHAFKIGNWDSDQVEYYAPFNDTDKNGVLKEGLSLCSRLNIPYSEVYLRTNTSYNPVVKDNNIYSDYKTGSSIERIIAFSEAGIPDVLQYADRDGTLKTWEEVESFARMSDFEHKFEYLTDCLTEENFQPHLNEFLNENFEVPYLSFEYLLEFFESMEKMSIETLLEKYKSTTQLYFVVKDFKIYSKYKKMWEEVLLASSKMN